MSYTYGDPSHAHAVTALSNGSTYAYDANGNLIQRVVGGQTYNLSYNAENHLTGVSGAASASFICDGRRVVATVGDETTVFVGNYFEWRVGAGESRKYYYAGASRIAMWTEAGGLQFILGDHLGSASVLVDPDGTNVLSQGYMPWGETRFGAVTTEYRYTGQYEQANLGLYYYGARWYDPALGRFAQADSIIPQASQGVQAWDRYAYVNNNPLRYDDQSGHDVGCYGKDLSECMQISLPNDLKWESNCSGVKCGMLFGSVEIYSETYQPRPSYDQGPTGQNVTPPSANKSPGVAIPNLVGVLIDILEPWAPTPTATIDSSLSYSIDEGGTLTFDELSVTNNTNTNVGIFQLIIEQKEGEATIPPMSEGYKLDEIIPPGQEEYIPVIMAIPMNSYLGVSLTGRVFSSDYIFFKIQFR